MKALALLALLTACGAPNVTLNSPDLGSGSTAPQTLASPAGVPQATVTFTTPKAADAAPSGAVVVATNASGTPVAASVVAPVVVPAPPFSATTKHEPAKLSKINNQSPYMSWNLDSTGWIISVQDGPFDPDACTHVPPPNTMFSGVATMPTVAEIAAAGSYLTSLIDVAVKGGTAWASDGDQVGFGVYACKVTPVPAIPSSAPAPT